MPDPRSVMKEFRLLDQKRLAEGLSKQEQNRYALLRDLIGPEIEAAREGFADAYKAAIGAAYLADKDAVGELTITVTRDGLVEAARIARDQFGYQQLMEIAGVDYPERAERFEVV